MQPVPYAWHATISNQATRREGPGTHRARPFCWFLAALGAAAALAAFAATGDPAPDAVFARVNDTVISAALYDAELSRAFRLKFYHGRPPEGQMAQLRREVGDALIDRVLLLAEAKRRGIGPDLEKSRAALEAIEARNRADRRWQQRREEVLPLLVQALQDESVLERLESAVREVPSPGAEQAREYFDAHPDVFTEPERLRVSVILLKVDPAAPQAEREAARTEAQRIRQRLEEGADFAALARERSGDRSAASGGDMGYVHRGMLPEELHAKLDAVAAGTLYGPLMLLEGAAVFRLEERLAPRLRSFEESKERAAGLWQRERAERQWRVLKSRLRSAATIEVLDHSRYPSAEAGSR